MVAFLLQIKKVGGIIFLYERMFYMNSKKQQEFLVPLSLCDDTSKLSVYAMFTLFMDIATVHAGELKLGADDLGENLFWITTRTKVVINRRPKMSEKITLSTWPQKAIRVRANRDYTISDDDGVMISARSEWTVVDVSTGKLQRLDDLYPADFEFCTEQAITEPFARVSADFSDGEEIAKYTVKSTDIDLVGHMNNSAYIRAFMGLFSCEYHADNPIKEIEISYKAQSYEGETLTIKKRSVDNAYEYAMIKEDSTIAAVLRVVRNG